MKKKSKRLYPVIFLVILFYGSFPFWIPYSTLDLLATNNDPPKDLLSPPSFLPLTQKEDIRNAAMEPPKPRSIRLEDKNCIFRQSPLYRSVFVYPSPGEPEWVQQQQKSSQSSILSKFGQSFPPNHRYPWQIIEEKTRQAAEYHFRVRDARATQYTAELLIRDLLTHPESCLRTTDPTQASLFFVPYMVSMEWHNGTQYPTSFETSPYGQAILDILQNQSYQAWEETWGLMSEYWKRRQGSDHILVMSEGCHGLSHPRGCHPSDVLVQAQQQLSSAIIIYKDTGKSFLQQFPQCSAKNILLPAPNADGRWLNGKTDATSTEIAQKAFVQPHTASLPNDPSHRPLAYYYKAGNHGTCTKLRQSLEQAFHCSPTAKYLKQQSSLLPKGYHFPHAYRHATFCPCPGGDTPNSKRYFDAVLAGCIPIVLSSEFVWPFSSEVPGATAWIHPDQFSLRWNTSELTHPDPCTGHSTTKNRESSPMQYHTIQQRIESIPMEQIRALQHGIQQASQYFQYYAPSPSLPENPLLERSFPNGQASRAIVAALVERQYGQRWPACQKETEEWRKNSDHIVPFGC